MSVLSLFEIAVPLRDNNGNTVPEGVHNAFEMALMRECGGYTKMAPTDGAWRDDATGTIHYDRMGAYRIACSAETMRAIVECAAMLYWDQKAFFVSEIGRSWIIPRAISREQLYRLTRTAGHLRNVSAVTP